MIRTIDIPDFSGGLNTRDGAGGVADNEYIEGLNVYLVARGIAKRKGYSRYTGTSRIDGATAGTSITDAQFVSAGQKIVGTAGTKIGLKGTSTWSDITGSVTLTAGFPVITTMVNDNLVGVNGQNPAFYYTGSGNALTLSGDNIPTTPEACEGYAGRLFLGNNNTLYWGGYMGDWKNFHPDSNQPFNSAIKGLKIYGDATNSFMLVLCDKNIYLTQFAPEAIQTGGRGQFVFDQITAKHGCAAPASVEECYVPSLGFCIVWADYDGIKIYNPSIGVQKVTDKIRPDWEALNLGNISKAVGKFYKTKGWYILSCSGASATTNNKQIIFDLYNSIPTEGRWTISGLYDWDASTLGTVLESGIEKLIGADSTGYWNKYDDTQNDNGVAIDGYFRTKAFGEPYYNKGFASLTMQYAFLGTFSLDIKTYYDSTVETFSVTHNITAGGSRLDELILDQDALLEEGGLAISSEELRGWGRTVQVKIRNNDTGEPFRIHRLTANYKPGRIVWLR